MAQSLPVEEIVRIFDRQSRYWGGPAVSLTLLVEC